MRSSRPDPGSDHLGKECHRALVATQQDQTEKKSDYINNFHDKDDDENEDTWQEIYQDSPALRELGHPIILCCLSVCWVHWLGIDIHFAFVVFISFA